jgi:polar amino acid transport system permease protein
MMVQLLLMTFVILKGIPNAMLVAVISFGLNSGAYVAEIFRGGINSIDKGQMEAARSLGMTHGMAMRLIIIPQAVRVILPAFANEFVTLIKETSVLGYVGVVEILRRGQLWNSSSFETFPAYIGVALAYMILTIPLSKIINGYERKVARRESAA